MNRVLKRTLYKLGVLFGIVFGVLAYGLGAMYIGYKLLGSESGGLVGFYAAGFLAFIIHWTYKDAKREIEYEDDELIRQLKTEEMNRKLKGL